MGKPTYPLKVLFPETLLKPDLKHSSFGDVFLAFALNDSGENLSAVRDMQDWLIATDCHYHLQAPRDFSPTLPPQFAAEAAMVASYAGDALYGQADSPRGEE